MQLLIFFFLISIVFSFLCSIWEAVLLSVPPSFVAAMQKEGRKSGQLLAGFKANIDRPLAAILTLNTIAHTVGAIGVGAQASRIWEGTYVLGVNVAAVLVPTVMTLGILVLSEIIPKTLGANYWRSLAPVTATFLNLLIYALYPLVVMSQVITRTLKRDKNKSVLSRGEFAAMAEVVAKDGVLKEREHHILKNLLAFDKVTAEEVMTPRTVVSGARQDDTVSGFLRQNPDMPFARMPVYEKYPDQISGFVLRKDIFMEMAHGREDTLIKDLTRKMCVMDEKTTLPAIFDTLVREHRHMAAVVDSYGAMVGIITLEDVLETLLGMEIVDELDKTTDTRQLARKLWKERMVKLGLKPPEDPGS